MAEQRPLVVACLRHADPRPEVDSITGAVRRDPLAATASAPDLAALEHALTLAEAWNGRTLAVTAGPAAADETLRQAAALGAAVLRVPWPEPDPPSAPRELDSAPAPADSTGGSYLAELVDDERALAAALAAAIGTVGEPSVVICGDRSEDRGTGALPAYLAHELNAAQALGLVSLTLAGGVGAAGGCGGRLAGERRLPGGRRERLHIPTPAVCSVEAAGLHRRRASLPATLAARRAVIPVAPAPVPASRQLLAVRIGAPRPYRPRTRVVPAPPAGPARERLLALTGVLEQHDPPMLVGPLDPGAAAEELLSFLRRTGYLGAGEGPAGDPGDAEG